MSILRKFDKNSRLKKKKKNIINNDDTFIDTSSKTTDNCFFNIDEKEVAKILQLLPQFILESDSSAYPFLSITWGVKKRRSLTNNESQSPPPPPPLLPSCNCQRTISSGKSFIPSIPLSFSSSGSFSKHSTCKRKTSNKLMMGDCNDQNFRNLELKSSPSFPQQRAKRRSFDLSSAEPTVFSPAAEEEGEEEEEESVGSLTKVADEFGFGSEINEQKSKYPYSEIAQSLSAEVGLGMAKHLNLLGIPDFNFAPEDNLFKSFDMNKQPPLQMC